MKIKKSVVVFLLAAVSAACFAGCNKSESSSAGETKTAAISASTKVDIGDFADKLKSDIKFDEELGEITGDKITSVLGISPDKYTKAKCYISTSGATPEEIDCFEAKDEEAAKEIKAALESRIETQKNTFKDYNADQAPKLEEPVLVVREKNVYLCISGDNDKAKELIG